MGQLFSTDTPRSSDAAAVHIIHKQLTPQIRGALLQTFKTLGPSAENTITAHAFLSHFLPNKDDVKLAKAAQLLETIVPTLLEKSRLYHHRHQEHQRTAEEDDNLFNCIGDNPNSLREDEPSTQETDTVVSFDVWCQAFLIVSEDRDQVFTDTIFDLLVGAVETSEPKPATLDQLRNFVYAGFELASALSSSADCAQEETGMLGDCIVPLFARTAEQTTVTRSQFASFVLSHGVRLLAPLALWFHQKFLGDFAHQPHEITGYLIPELSVESNIEADHPLRNGFVRWALGALQPPFSFCRKQGHSALLKAVGQNHEPAVGWRKLFSSQTEGRSLRVLLHAVDGYDGPTLLILQTPNRTTLGAFVSQPWRVGSVLANSTTKSFGDHHCFLFSHTAANFQIFPANLESVGNGGNLAAVVGRHTTQSQNVGICFGGKVSHPRLWICDTLDRGTCGEVCGVYRRGELCHDQEFAIAWIEIWGCGDNQSAQAQAEFRAHEAQDRERLKKSDVRGMVGEDGEVSGNQDLHLLHLGAAT